MKKIDIIEILEKIYKNCDDCRINEIQRQIGNLIKDLEIVAENSNG